jgi:hypothetical protein
MRTCERCTTDLGKSGLTITVLDAYGERHSVSHLLCRGCLLDLEDLLEKFVKEGPWSYRRQTLRHMRR